MIRFSLEFQFWFFTAASYQETRHFVGCLFSLSRVIMPTVKSHWSHIVKIRLIVCGAKKIGRGTNKLNHTVNSTAYD